jgi:hypothetical protein
MTSAAAAAAAVALADEPLMADGFMKGKYIHRATSSSISRFSARKEIFFSIFAAQRPRYLCGAVAPP